MAKLQFDQVNIVVSDVIGAAGFLRALGAEIPELPDEWAEWAPHHIGFPAVASGFDADLDSAAFASHWGGLPEGFTGVVVNLRAEDRDVVDAVFEQAVAVGAEALRDPYDAFFGARYAVVRGPGPVFVGIMSPIDQDRRSESPSLSDFA